MTKQTALAAYRRTTDLERRMSERLRATILVPYFGGCMCRMHNCRINYENGYAESGVLGLNHKQLAHMARQFDYQQDQIWNRTRTLRDAFAQNF